MQNRKELIKRRKELVEEHRKLDDLITKLGEERTLSLEIQRLKKRKLSLKDEIAYLDKLLIPDIIA